VTKPRPTRNAKCGKMWPWPRWAPPRGNECCEDDVMNVCGRNPTKPLRVRVKELAAFDDGVVVVVVILLVDILLF
jgi:hypothetical protein